MTLNDPTEVRKTIHKHTVPVDDVLDLPAGAEILTVQVQDDVPRLWVLVNPDYTETEPRRICTYGTGHPIEGDVEYIGTFQLRDGSLVFHVFEVMS